METEESHQDSPISIRVLRQASPDGEVRAELREALLSEPPRIPSKYFYDERGSDLFEEITELPEYYQTRTEAALLESLAGPIARETEAELLVELGSGAATKTRLLLDGLRQAGHLQLYVPLDVSEATTRRVAAELEEEFPGLRVHGIIGDFMEDLDEIPRGGRRLLAFLGGTIGNLRPAQARFFLRRLRQAMGHGDHFLLGTDLIKPVERLEAAYNDSQGVTAEFNRNVLRVVNRLVNGDFEPEAFEHQALYNREKDWIEMWLVATRRQEVRLEALDLVLELEPGDKILTEISAKYDRQKVEALLADSDLELLEWFTDPEELFALSLARIHS